MSLPPVRILEVAHPTSASLRGDLPAPAGVDGRERADSHGAAKWRNPINIVVGTK